MREETSNEKYFIFIIFYLSIFLWINYHAFVNAQIFTNTLPYSYYNPYNLIQNNMMNYYSNPYINLGMMSPYSGLWPLTNSYPNVSAYNYFLPGLSNYYGNFASPFQLQTNTPSLFELLSTYQYLQYAANFYSIAKDVPLLYLRDIQADQLGAIIFTYAHNENVSTQDSILYFLKQLLTQQ